MPKPIRLCLEDLDPAPGEPRFVACFALSVGEVGLALGPRGEILWMRPERVAVGLEVDEYGELAMRVGPGLPQATLERLRRVFQIPSAAQPSGTAGVLHQDVVGYGLKRYRVHVHGPAAETRPPREVETDGLPEPRPEALEVIDFPPAETNELPEPLPEVLDVIDFPPEPSLPDGVVGEGPQDKGWEPDIVLPEEEPEK